MNRSSRLNERTRRVLPAGTGAGLYFASAEGSRLRTADGRDLVDFTAASGRVILGYGDADVAEAVRSRVSRGLPGGFPREDEIEFAELLVSLVPFADGVCLTETEGRALNLAADLARAFTGRSKVVYAAFNDAGALGKSRNRASLAAVVAEPLALGIGVVEAVPGFLKALRDFADASGALLVFDERKTAFRFGLSAYAAFAGIRPDLVVAGGLLGGGFPLGVVGGRGDVIGRARETEGPHPAAVAAGAAVLSKLERDDPYGRLELYARRIELELDAFAAENAMDFRLARCGGVFSPFFCAGPVKTEAEARATDVRRYGMFARRMLDRGWYLPVSPFDPCYVTAAHADDEIDGFLEAAKETLEEVFETV